VAVGVVPMLAVGNYGGHKGLVTRAGSMANNCRGTTSSNFVGKKKKKNNVLLSLLFLMIDVMLG